MKFTKQETSMIKVAAAFVAPQHKQAALQSKLAEYGIGLTKRAEASQFETANRPDIQDPWHMDRMAEDARLEADWRKSKEELDKRPEVWPEPQVDRKQRLLRAVMSMRDTPVPGAGVYNMGNPYGQKAQQFLQRRAAARGAINGIKTNGWSTGLGLDTGREYRRKNGGSYGNRLFKDLAELAKNPEDLNDSIVKANRAGVAPGTFRSDSTGLMSGNGRALPRILAPQR